jgi:hypothetical protein
MKKNILFFLTFFFIISFRISAQPSSPVLVAPPEEASVTIIPVTLDWNDVDGADCYLIEVTTDTNTNNKMSDTCNGYSSSYTIPAEETELNTIYYWRVAAHDNSGWGDFSYYFSFKTSASTTTASIGNLIDGVIDLISDGGISQSQGNILINRLELAQNQLEFNYRAQAIFHMILFKVRVFILRISGLISAKDADALNYSADGVIDLISELGRPQPVDIEKLTTPETFALSQNYPNPFNPATTIEYSIPENAFVSLKIYDMLGKEVASLVNKTQGTGTYIIDWNASNLSSGVYFYKLSATGSKGNFIETKKMILSK